MTLQVVVVVVVLRVVGGARSVGVATISVMVLMVSPHTLSDINLNNSINSSIYSLYLFPRCE